MWLWDLIKGLWGKIKNLFRRVVRGALNFFRDIIGWFKKFRFEKGNDIPFVIDAHSNQFKQLLKEAPTKNAGIFNGNYNQEDDEITHSEFVEADSLDEQTRNLLQNEEIVVLS